MFNLQKLKNSNVVRALIYISLFYLTFYSMMELLSTDKKPIFKRYDFYCFIFSLSFFMLAVNFYYKRKNKTLTKIKIILFNISLSIVLYFLIFLCIYAIAFSFNFFEDTLPILVFSLIIPFLFTTAFIWAYATNHKKTYISLLFVSILLLPSTLSFIAPIISPLFPHTRYVDED